MLNLKNSIIASLSILALLFSVFVIIYSSQQSHKNPDYLAAVKLAINKDIEKDAVSCGFKSIEVNPYSFNKCVIEAESKNIPYWVAYQVQGEDSVIWLAYSKLGNATYEQKIFDSYSQHETNKVEFKKVHTETCPFILFSAGNLSEQQLHSQLVFGC